MANRREFLQRALLAIGAVAVHPLPGALYGAVQELPKGWKFYEIGGQVLFNIYGSSGGLSTGHVCYLVRGRSVIAIGFKDLEFMAVADDEEAVKRVVNAKINRAIKRGNWQHVDWDGGLLPKPEWD